MSFQQGLSGLNAASKQLEVIGNNVANANTVGFKQARAEFADVFANSLSGGGGSAIGIGTKLATVAQQFTQGNITSTSNALDLAINGGGFFRMSNNGTVTYSRNGQFQMDKDGYIVDASSKRLTGFSVSPTTGNLDVGTPSELFIDTKDLDPNTTTEITGTVNLDSRKPVLTTALFDPTDPTTYSDSTAITVFDSLGNAHTIQSFFVKAASSAASSDWDIYTTVDGTLTTGVSAGVPTSSLNFTGTGTSPTVTAGAGLQIDLTNGSTTPINMTLDYSSSTQFGAAFSINSLVQDGYTSGRLTGFNTSQDGTIVGRYTNGKSKILGQVTLTSFTNPNGLQSLGDNAWADTAASGPPLPSFGATPGTGTLGVLQSSAVEDSNTDLTAELVNMITAQRFYQANAQTIKTQDQVLQTLVNLR